MLLPGLFSIDQNFTLSPIVETRVAGVTPDPIAVSYTHLTLPTIYSV